MQSILQFAIAFVLIPLIDYIWLAKIMQKFYLAELGPLARMESGVFSPQILPAIGVYAALAMGIVVFVLWRTNSDWLTTFIYGALLGFAIYAVYDLTNLSVLQNYSLKLTVVDIVWGTFLCGMVSVITAKISQLIIS